MASGNNESKTVWPVFLPLIIGLPLVMILAFVFHGSNSGTSPAQPADPSNAAIQSMFSKLDMYTDPNALVKADSAKLEELKTALTLFQSQIISNDPSLSSLSNKSDAQSAVASMISDLTCIETNATATNKSKAQQCATDFHAKMASLEKLAVVINGSIVDTAKAIIEYNNPGGHPKGNVGKIKYLYLHKYIFKNGWPTYLDCSGFMGYIFSKIGAWPAITVWSPTTGDMWSASANSNNKLHLSRVLTGKIYLSRSDITTNINNGTIKPGDMMLIGNPEPDHVMMYIGGDLKGDSFAESKGHLLGGPQYASISSVPNNVLGVLRVNVPAGTGSAAPVATTSGNGKYTVCIDPGHPAAHRLANGTYSGVNTGTETNIKVNGAPVTEQHLAWVIGQKLKTDLVSAGYSVVMTKQTEAQSINNKERAQVCNNAGSDLMFRLHFDAVGGYGFTAYVPEAQGDLDPGKLGPSTAVISGSKQAGASFLPAFSRAIGTPVSGYKINSLQPDSATAIGSGLGNGKVLEASYYTQSPTVLVEMANLKDDNQARWIIQDSSQSKMATALTEGIKAIHGPQ